MTTPPTNPLHLLRALLRECTYLPDPNSRKYIHSHILWSYRNYLPKIKEWRKEIPLERQVSLLHRGRQSLSLLRRANEGYVRPLHKILSMTYGRSGKRRRELMSVLVAPETPQNSEALQNLVVVRKYSQEWAPPPQLVALMKSQREQVSYLGENKRAIKPIVNIPDTNIWGKMMPKSRVRNMTREWYAKQTNYVLPPLPESERQALRSLATGEEAWWPVLRRTQLGRPSTSEAFEQSLQQTILEGPQKSPHIRNVEMGRPHELTDRFMRRLWSYVYQHVPTMFFDTDQQRWSVEWHELCTRSTLSPVVNESHQTLLFGEPEESLAKSLSEPDAAAQAS